MERVYEGYYLSGRAFFVAQCPRCGEAGVLLNSGHHYQTLEAAEAEVARHDAEKHA